MSGNRSNRVEVPEAKAAMDRFKTEVASELGVNLKEGYNGDLTSRVRYFCRDGSGYSDYCSQCAEPCACD